MANDLRTEGEATLGRDHGRLSWLDSNLLGVALASLGIVLLSLFVQVRFGYYDTSTTDAWYALFDADVWYEPRVLLSFLLGEELMRTVLLVPESYEVPRLATDTNIVWNGRIPRVLVGSMVGVNFAVAGAILQAVTRNELASPYTLGITNGAGLAVLATLVVFSGLSSALPIIAALGGTVAFLVVYAIAWNGGTSPVRLVLAGIVVAYVCNSIQFGLYIFAEDVATIQSGIAWTMGSMTGAGWEDVRLVFPWTVATVALAFAGARQLNVLALGEQTASSLGMSVERVRFALSAVAVVAVGSAIAVAGIVAFAGLIVPHVVRAVVGSNYVRLLAGCLFVGPALVVSADVGARLGLQFAVGSPTELPVGVVTGIVGGGYFVYLMRKRREMGEL